MTDRLYFFFSKTFLTCSQCMHNVLFYIIKIFFTLTLLCVFFFWLIKFNFHVQFHNKLLFSKKPSRISREKKNYFYSLNDLHCVYFINHFSYDLYQKDKSNCILKLLQWYSWKFSTFQYDSVQNMCSRCACLILK